MYCIQSFMSFDLLQPWVRLTFVVLLCGETILRLSDTSQSPPIDIDATVIQRFKVQRETEASSVVLTFINRLVGIRPNYIDGSILGRSLPSCISISISIFYFFG